ncbi:RIP metalloprotease RseP [uncultured Brachyspira sp.]|uniref:RIP metalloprotease RseP n=1 Tax=uncultured Brachyspira sp. TaxID=221953 RepID=UPI0025F4F1B9|nr:RIP metalloprotease RseP [uncultured Brachyspira sp.]
MSWIGAVILLSILVFVHEMGHLLAGLAVGIKAEAFSIGFGPILLKKQIKGIDFRFSAIPFGGYCKFKGEISEDGNVEEGDFLNMPPIKRIIVYFAGPFFNYLFAFFLIAILLSIPSKIDLYSPTVSVFKDGKYMHSKSGITLAYEYGIQSGDTITAVNGIETEYDNDILKTINDEALQKAAEEIVFTINRNGEIINITLPSSEMLKALSGERALGLYFGDELIIKNIIDNSAAFEAGLLEGDKIISINGISAGNIADFRPIVMDNPSKKINITVIRDGKEITREAIPSPIYSKSAGTYGSLGVEFENIPVKVETVQGIPFPKSIPEAFKETGNYIISYINGLKLLFTGKLSLRENLGGPVRIIQISSQVISVDMEYRLRTILSFTATISLILFLMNLLPLPVVDGGMIVFSFIELIMRRSINRKVLTKIQAIGAAFLITLAIFITINDITQLFR